MNKHKIEVNQMSDKSKVSLKKRLLSALGLFLICFPCLILGGWFWFAVVTIALCIGIYELMKVTGKKYPWPIWVVTYLLTLSFEVWFIIKGNVNASSNPGFVVSPSLYSSAISISIYGIAASVGFYFLCAVVSEKFTFGDAAFFIAMTLMLGLGFQSLLFVRFYPEAYLYIQSKTISSDPAYKYFFSCTFIIFVLLATFLNDAGAYFVGMLFGKHKMNPRVSPNKTWEGLIGGWIIASLLSFLFAFILNLTGHPVIPQFKDQWWWIFLLAALLPGLANIGDLALSLVKRNYGIKDFGTLLPGMGGILDRADSLLFTCTLASIFAVFLSNNWNFFL